jgi:hypothetical protein
MVAHGSQVGQYGSNIACGLHTAPHGSQLNQTAPIWWIWLPYNDVPLPYKSKQLPYSAHSLHLTPHTSHMAHTVHRASTLAPYGFHMTQREPHAPLRAIRLPYGAHSSLMALSGACGSNMAHTVPSSACRSYMAAYTSHMAPSSSHMAHVAPIQHTPPPYGPHLGAMQLSNGAICLPYGTL